MNKPRSASEKVVREEESKGSRWISSPRFASMGLRNVLTDDVGPQCVATETELSKERSAVMLLRSSRQPERVTMNYMNTIALY